MKYNREFAINLSKNEKLLKRLAIKFTNDPEEIRELVQETIVRSLKFIDQYFDNPKIVSWLFVIMRNTYISDYRKIQKKHRFESYERAGYKNDGCSCPITYNDVANRLLAADISKELEKYPQDYQDLFTYYCDGYKYRELAEMFGLPEGTVKTRIHYIRRYLQKKLRAYRPH